MKVKILYTALISLIAGGAMAQDCTFFFPQTEEQYGSVKDTRRKLTICYELSSG